MAHCCAIPVPSVDAPAICCNVFGEAESLSPCGRGTGRASGQGEGKVGGYKCPRSHGPVIATVIPGVWMLTNNVWLEGSQHAPQNSLSR